MAMSLEESLAEFRSAGITGHEFDPSQQALALQRAREAAADRAASRIERADRTDGGRETTMDARNFTQKLTLDRLSKLYNTSINTAEKKESVLTEILTYLRGKEYPITIRETNESSILLTFQTKDVAFFGAKYYSHKNSRWSDYQAWDYTREYSVPDTLYLWWCAAKDPFISTSTVENRKKAFLRAMEETYRAHNRDNPTDQDNGSEYSQPACAMGFKNKLAECFKEILNARHPDNLYIADIADFFKILTRKVFLSILKERSDQAEIKKIWEKEEAKFTREDEIILSQLKDAVKRKLQEVLKQIGIEPESAEDKTQIRNWVRDMTITLIYQEYPTDRELAAFSGIEISVEGSKETKDEKEGKEEKETKEHKETVEDDARYAGELAAREGLDQNAIYSSLARDLVNSLLNIDRLIPPGTHNPRIPTIHNPRPIIPNPANFMPLPPMPRFEWNPHRPLVPRPAVPIPPPAAVPAPAAATTHQQTVQRAKKKGLI